MREENQHRSVILPKGIDRACLRDMPKAVLFDMDGVLYDTMPRHAKAWHTTMRKFGINMPELLAFELEGMRGVEIVQMLAKQQLNRRLTDDEAQRMYETKGKAFAAMGEAVKMAGVEELMRQIKADGLRIGIVTGSGQRTLLDKLEQSFSGLIEAQYVVTSFDVKRGKPAPDPYLMGLEKVGVQPQEAVVIENAPLGVRAAVAAGIFTIAVNTGPLPESSLAAEGADLVFPTMTALRDSWKSLFRQENI